MDQRIAAAMAATCAALLADAALALPAFPGAEGFGADALGGRGGDVYHVTSLADTLTPGTLRYGLRESGFPAAGRTIVFDVGGTIQLGSTALDIKNISKVTIAGQTAPTPITIVGNTVQITGSNDKNTNDVILQHVILRKGSGDGEDALSIKGSLGSGTTNRIIVDHVSGSWSEDEVISVTQRATNVTVQNSMMSEALTSDHAYGALIRPMVDSNVTYNRNLFSNQKSRNPRPGTYDGATLNLEFQNNVIYNWSDRAGYIAGADGVLQIMNMNYAGNYLIAGPSTPSGIKRTTGFIKEVNASPLELHVFQEQNKLDSLAGAARDGTDTGWTMFRMLSGGTYSAWPEADKEVSRFAFPASSPDSADDAYAKMIASVGAFPWSRSETDQRLISDVLDYTGFAPITAPPANEWTAITTAATAARPAGWDTDFDGMPNWWETLRGFNPSAADNNVLTVEGYTRLEKYLHYLSAQANWNHDGDGNWSAYMNWRGERPQTSDGTANFIAGITAPRTVTVNMPVTVGAMTFAGDHAYTVAGGNSITMDVIAGTATIDVQGSHAIVAPLAMNDTTRITVADAGDVLTISNLQPATASLIKEGPGTLAVNQVRAGALTVNGGTVKVEPSAGASSATSAVNMLDITAGQLDLTDNKLVVRGGVGGAMGSWNGSAYTGTQGLVQSGYNAGAWDGNGIVTSMSDATAGILTTLAVVSADDAGLVGQTFGGVNLESGDALVMYTWGGDAQLDGDLDGDDYFQIDSNVAQSESVFGYNRGDFNYDGLINGDDYFIIDSNIAFAQTQPAFATGAGAAISAVPEPTAALLATAGLPALRRRRRR